MKTYKNKLLAQECQNMDLVTAAEHCPVEMIKTFKKMKEKVKEKVNKENIAKFGNREVESVVDTIKNIDEDDINNLADICSNIKNIPALLVIEKIDHHGRNLLTGVSDSICNNLIKYSDHVNRSKKDCGGKFHRYTLQFLYTIREFIRLELDNS